MRRPCQKTSNHLTKIRRKGKIMWRVHYNIVLTPYQRKNLKMNIFNMTIRLILVKILTTTLSYTMDARDNVKKINFYDVDNFYSDIGVLTSLPIIHNTKKTKEHNICLDDPGILMENTKFLEEEIADQNYKRVRPRVKKKPPIYDIDNETLINIKNLLEKGEGRTKIARTLKISESVAKHGIKLQTTPVDEYTRKTIINYSKIKNVKDIANILNINESSVFSVIRKESNNSIKRSPYVYCISSDTKDEVGKLLEKRICHAEISEMLSISNSVIKRISKQLKKEISEAHLYHKSKKTTEIPNEFINVPKICKAVEFTQETSFSEEELGEHDGCLDQLIIENTIKNDDRTEEINKSKTEIAVRMLTKKLDDETIMECLGITADELTEIKINIF